MDTHFFFSSRRRHTRFDCDWSSDVCSSDLDADERYARAAEFTDVVRRLWASFPNEALKIDRDSGRYADASLDLDRKSTRLNSSHSQISYAVFCLKKKKLTGRKFTASFHHEP